MKLLKEITEALSVIEPWLVFCVFIVQCIFFSKGFIKRQKLLHDIENIHLEKHKEFLLKGKKEDNSLKSFTKPLSNKDKIKKYAKEQAELYMKKRAIKKALEID